MTITDNGLRRIAFYWSESDPQWCKLEFATRVRVDDEWHFKILRLTTMEAAHLAKIIQEGHDHGNS